MNDAEWSAIAEQLDYSFKGEFDEKAEAVYRRKLGGLPFATVDAALDALVNAGQTFMPALGEIVAAMNRAAAPPPITFDEAWAHIEPTLSDGQACLARLESLGAPELAQKWVASYGPQRLAHEPLYDPAYAGATIHRIRQSFEQFAGLVVQRLAEGLDPYPALERSGRAGLGRPDFEGSLGAVASPPELTAGSEER